MENTGFRIVLCSLPDDDQLAQETGYPLCHLAYRVGSNGRLFRGALGVNVRGGLLGVSDRDVTGDTPYSPELARELKRECDLRGYSGVLCDFERPPSPELSRFAYEAAIYFASLHMSFYLPESYASAAPGAKLLISSSVIGGSCDELLRKSVFKYGANRVAMVFDPVCVDFAMPAPRSLDADRVSPEELENIRSMQGAVPYFSHELCANYFTYRTGEGQSRFALFDDARSMVKKLDAARRAGFHEVFVCYPDARDSLTELSALVI